MFKISISGLIIPDRFYDDFWSDGRTDARVRAIAIELALWLNNKFGDSLLMTSLIRTREEQVAIYGDDKPSGHRCLPCRAIDFSRKGLSDERIMMLIRRFNMYYKHGLYWSLLWHNVGAGDHLHLQVPSASWTVDLTKAEI